MKGELESIKKKVREAVVLFEHKEGSKTVDQKDIGTLVRYLGVNPTNAQVAMIVEQLNALNADAEPSSLMPLEHVETIVSNFMVQQQAALFRDDYHTLIRAFRAFDTEGKGYIMAEQLKNALTAKGETFSEDEVNKMLGYAADDSGRIFCECMCVHGDTMRTGLHSGNDWSSYPCCFPPLPIHR